MISGYVIYFLIVAPRVVLFDIGTAYALGAHVFTHSAFSGVRVAQHYVFCVVLFALFVIVLCLVRAVFPISLDCTFSSVPSAFFNVYFNCGEIPLFLGIANKSNFK